MFANPIARYHTNQNAAESACEHCGGVVRHEHWCITRNALVRYAHGVVAEPEKLTLLDRLTLHALGVSWASNAGAGACSVS